MMTNFVHSALIATLALIFSPAQLLAQNTSPPVAAKDKKPTVPSREVYPDVGQEFGMVWHYTNYDNRPYLAFMVPETDNMLWTMNCEKQGDGPRKGQVRIANMIVANPKEAFAGDQFGMTVRVDDGASIGILVRMKPARLEDNEYSMPQFYLPNNHALFPALARGNRAYINLSGKKFSVHLNGSGEALIKFLRACR